MTDPLAREIPQPLDWLEGNPEFFIDHIVAHRLLKSGKKTKVEYLVRWAGFDDSHDSYEPRGITPPGQHNIFDDYDDVHNINHITTNKVVKPAHQTVTVDIPVSQTLQSGQLLPNFTIGMVPQDGTRLSHRKKIPTRRFG